MLYAIYARFFRPHRFELGYRNEFGKRTGQLNLGKILVMLSMSATSFRLRSHVMFCPSTELMMEKGLSRSYVDDVLFATLTKVSFGKTWSMSLTFGV